MFLYRHHVAHMGNAAVLAEIGNERMSAVQQPELHLLVGRNVLDEERPGRLPDGTAGAEPVLDDPLHERLGLDGRLVTATEEPLRIVQRLPCGRRDDAVHHRRGERNVLRDPARQVRVAPVGELPDQPFDDMTVGRKVVAADHRERPDFRLPPAGKPFHQMADHPARAARRRQIVGDVRVSGVEVAAAGIDAVGLFSHRQRDDADVAVGEPLEHGARTVASRVRPDDRADDLRPRRFPFANEDAVETRLGLERAGRFGGAKADGLDAPGAEGVRERCVRIDGLVGTMECAEADVQDPGLQAIPVVVRHADPFRQPHRRRQPPAGHAGPKPGCDSVRMMPRNSARPFSRPIAG